MDTTILLITGTAEAFLFLGFAMGYGRRWAQEVRLDALALGECLFGYRSE